MKRETSGVCESGMSGGAGYSAGVGPVGGVGFSGGTVPFPDRETMAMMISAALAMMIQMCGLVPGVESVGSGTVTLMPLR